MVAVYRRRMPLRCKTRASRSIAKTRIATFEVPNPCGPVCASTPRIMGEVLPSRALTDFSRDLDHRRAGSFEQKLSFTRYQIIPGAFKRLARCATDDRKAVILQHQHDVVRAQGSGDSLSLAKVIRDALVCVGADALVETQRVLR